MEEYEKTDKTWWWATDFMYKHLLSTGQSWSHVQKLEFVKNLSEMLKRIERTAKLPQKEKQKPFDAMTLKYLKDKLKMCVRNGALICIYETCEEILQELGIPDD